MILVHTPNPKEVAAYLDLFQAAMPEESFASLDQADLGQVRHLIAWGLPDGLIARLPKLRAVFALGAGVDKLLSRPDLPADLPLYRLLDSGMAAQMTEYIRYGVLGYQRNMDVYRRQQAAGQWRMLAPRLPGDIRVGILGLGEIGSAAAKALSKDGYQVSGWSRSPKHIHHVRSLHGDAGLEKLLENSDVLACVLPSTPQTQGLLNGERLSLMPPGSMLINAGRGDLLDQDALLALLNNGHIRCAQLDVFAQEPLPHGHPLWQHPSVAITPHIAAITLRQQAVEQITANLRKLAAGQEADGLVVRSQGY
ncbi:2-hydroxyacid dehydrogenase [Chromobacterium piscinae]|uniref:2-hydroxyacid dehydrogenase n=1 Tax=Chromobacterium piscinae TaxID=686831 RepID=UPI00140D952E|nr:glyoxylate/hydroxypyruvate reductase A [Chromobacterium piscinae]MBX9298638.1 glyoxylate/hydroxypyruvate reductase A [Chromobacterium vaccinii]MBX9347379.1 glyoxylate/hydroxypyruvate reductase A [Chromobacterium vaccinii]MBX9357543.1 glyoxylate/hydroxypyruvate reductase A [Chromobacterium vaccinii]MCD5328056.1 glyoxylate/hydroxypyruvate reductase A [Chromobacterium piscinae]NHQ80673.1 glyoxylate/hydroxypyruvate reductase A [Chromobacterium vaccinii]